MTHTFDKNIRQQIHEMKQSKEIHQLYTNNPSDKLHDTYLTFLIPDGNDAILLIRNTSQHSSQDNPSDKLQDTYLTFFIPDRHDAILLIQTQIFTNHISLAKLI